MNWQPIRQIIGIRLREEGEFRIGSTGRSAKICGELSRKTDQLPTEEVDKGTPK